MKYFIEMFSAKQSWLDLTKEEKSAYLTQVNESSKPLMDQWVAITSMNENDQDTIQRAGYSFFVIWTMPTDELADAVQKLMLTEGWFNYFDQLNLKGGAADIFDKLINM